MTEKKMTEARKIAIRIANAMCENELEYFENKKEITEKDIWTYIDESYDIFPCGSSDQLAPIVFEILKERKWEGLKE